MKLYGEADKRFEMFLSKWIESVKGKKGEIIYCVCLGIKGITRRVVNTNIDVYDYLFFTTIPGEKEEEETHLN